MEMTTESIVPMTTLHEHLEHLQSNLSLPGLFLAPDGSCWLVLAPTQAMVKVSSISSSPSKIKGQRIKRMEQIGHIMPGYWYIMSLWYIMSA